MLWAPIDLLLAAASSKPARAEERKRLLGLLSRLESVLRGVAESARSGSKLDPCLSNLASDLFCHLQVVPPEPDLQLQELERSLEALLCASKEGAIHDANLNHVLAVIQPAISILGAVTYGTAVRTEPE